MIYLVTNNIGIPQTKGEFLESIKHPYQVITVEKSLEILSYYDILGLDTETTGLDCHTDKITLLQLGTFTEQIIVDCTSVDINYYKEILESKKVLKIAANIKFDLQFLYKNNIWCQNIWDILTAEYVIYNGLNETRLHKMLLKYAENAKVSEEVKRKLLRKSELGWYSLLALVCWYCDYYLNKSLRENYMDYLSDSFIKYSADDIRFLIDIYHKQSAKAVSDGCWKAIYIENGFTEALAYVEYCGLGIDKDSWMAMYNRNKTKMETCLEKLNQFVLDNNMTKYIDYQLDLFSDGHKVKLNWNSPAQLIKFFNDLGVSTVDKDGKQSVDSSVLESQKDKSPIIDLFLEYSDCKKLATTYGEEFLKYVNPSTGRIHCDYTQLVSTSRLSSSKPNLQNIPHTEEFRACFVSKDGNLFTSCDYSGQESNVLINASKEPKLIKFYQDGNDDLHSFVAQLTFPEVLKDKSLKEIKQNHKDLRQIAKSVEFASAYGGTGFTIAKNIGVSPEEGDRIYTQYMKAFPGLKDYFEKVGLETKTNGYVTISKYTGRRFYIEDFEKYEYLRQAKYNNSLDPDGLREFSKLDNKIQRISQNFPIQGSSSEICKCAVVLLFRYLKEHNLHNKMLITALVHDEICVEYPESMPELEQVIVGCMEKGAEKYCTIIPLKAEASTGKHWIH